MSRRTIARGVRNPDRALDHLEAKLSGLQRDARDTRGLIARTEPGTYEHGIACDTLICILREIRDTEATISEIESELDY